jgi:ATP-dependent helicase/nuclease subunit B
MAVHVHTVPYGAPALERLAALVDDAQRADRLAPVTVVVPTNYVGVATRRALARRGGLAGVSFLTAYRLAELLGAARLARDGRRPVSTPVLAAAVRQALRRVPGCFEAVREHPATEQALVTAHRELRDVGAGALATLARASERAGDVVRIHRDVTAQLAAEWYDEADLLAAATAVVHEGAPSVAALGTVVVHLPQRLSVAAGALLWAVAARSPVHVVAGVTGHAAADDGVRRAVDRLGGDLGAPMAEPPVLPADVQVVTTADADDEVRAALRHVVAAARRGVPLERIAMCYATPEPYGRLCGELLAAAGIPHNGRATTPLRERVAARALLGLLALPDHDVSRQDLFALLASAPFVTADGRPVPTGAWERASREAGVVAGQRQWDERLRGLAAGLRRAAEAPVESADDTSAALLERARRRAGEADELRAFVLDLCGWLAALSTTWDGLAALGHHLVDHFLGSDQRRMSWPEPERVAADKVLAALDRVRGLDPIDPHPSMERFRRTLELELDADLGRVGRLGDGVFVGPVGLALGQDLDVVVVLGMAEGTFPTRPADDVLLPDRERARVGDVLALAADAQAWQHHQLRAVLATARQQVVLCWPRGDLRRSTEHLASRWLLDVVGARTGERVWSHDVLQLRAPWVEHVASFGAGVAAASFPATAQEHRLRSLLHHRPLPADSAFDRGARLLRARRSARFTEYDGNLGGLTVPSPADPDQLVSTTRLEAWAACPLHYFLRFVLGVVDVENPEDVLRLSALDKGSLLHATLDRFLREVLARPTPLQPAPDEPWGPDDGARLVDLFDEEAARFVARGLTGRDLFWRQDRRAIVRDLQTLLREDSARRREQMARPFATELRFGFDDAPVAVPLTAERAVRFRGMVDRVDRTDAGDLVVIDYKTGRSDAYRHLGESEPTLGGTRLQLPVYALAARAATGWPDAPASAEYWFVTTTGKFHTRAVPLTPAVLEQVRADIAIIVGGIEAGHFPAHPHRPVWQFGPGCVACDGDGAGTSERWHEWTRKKDAPEMAEYLTLAARQGADRG